MPLVEKLTRDLLVICVLFLSVISTMTRLLGEMDLFTRQMPKQELLHIPDDLLLLSLNSLPLGNQISIRRVCRRFQSVLDLLLSRRKHINKGELRSLSFDGREWLLKESVLTCLQSVTLVSIELNEDLAKRLARFSPSLREIIVDGTCYNRCHEFVQDYLFTFSQFHPNRIPNLQVNNLIEIDEKVQELIDKFPKWNVHLTLLVSNLCSWTEYLKYVHTLKVTRNTGSILEEFQDHESWKSVFPNLQIIVFSGVTVKDCFPVKDCLSVKDCLPVKDCLSVSGLMRIVEEVVFENLCVKDSFVILSLAGTKLKRLEINLNHDKGTRTSKVFLPLLCDYFKCDGRELKFLKVTTSRRDDSIQLIRHIIELGFKDMEFDVGNPSEKFSFSRKKLSMRYWTDPLTPLLSAFSKVRNVNIVASPSFDVLEWISEIKSFAGQHLNRSIHFSVVVEGQPETGPVISVNGHNYTLTIPKVAGMIFTLTSNNVLFAFTLAEMSQMTELRNQSLSFMKAFLGTLPKDSSAREICDFFKILQKENEKML